MQTIYHVAQDGWDGADLLSLYAQYRDDAYDQYAERWPDAGELCYEHAHYVHCHASLSDATAFQADHGGDLLIISLDEDDIVMDVAEYPHPMVRDAIPAHAIIRG